MSPTSVVLLSLSVCCCLDEEISAMRLELEKYGIQMPAFSKIGGILANEVNFRVLNLTDLLFEI